MPLYERRHSCRPFLTDGRTTCVQKRVDPVAAKRALGRRVAELRRRAGATQSALAERADVTVRYLQGLEAGDFNPTLTTLLALAFGLGVRAAELLRPPRSTKPAKRGRPPGVVETRERRRVGAAKPRAAPRGSDS
jgi:transcriptional regulator with XRE-family HTH domain